MVHVEAESPGKSGSGTLAQRLYEEITKQIVRGDFVPGERLVEGDLATQFGVGRGSIREALRRLEANRFVQFEPNRGAMVARPTAKQVNDMLRIRAAIAGLGARGAAENIDEPGNREIISALIEEIEKELGQQSPAFHRKGNGRFHRTLNDMSGIEDIGKLMDQVNIPMLYEIYFRELSEEQWRINLNDHYDMARAVLAGDGDAAEAVARRHMFRMIDIAKSIAERWAD